MTKTYCDLCGQEIGDPQAGGAPVSYKLDLTHWSSAAAWEVSDIIWPHICPPCSGEVATLLRQLQDRKVLAQTPVG